MRTTKTAITERNGKITEIKVEVTKEVQDKIAFADGLNIKTGTEIFEATYITIVINGKVAVSTRGIPETIVGKRGYEKAIAAGAYARLGDKYIGKEMYDIIAGLLAEANAEIEETAEYAEVKAAEIAKAERIAKADKETETHGSGWCNKCQSYCWGDCES